jgi:hypothetical protein
VRFARTTSDPILSPRHRHLGIFILRTPDGSWLPTSFSAPQPLGSIFS